MKKFTRFLLGTLVFALISVSGFAQPGNDDCGGATAVTPDGTCVAGTTVAANDGWTGTVGCQSGGGTHEDVWYSFVATGTVYTGTITTSGAWTGNIEFTLVSSATGCAGPFTLVGSACGASPLAINIPGLTNGATYYFTVSTIASGTPGPFSVCSTTSSPAANCTDNDDCLSPQNIAFVAGVQTCLTDCNTGAAPGPEFAGNNCFDFPNSTVWYEVTTGASSASIDVDLTSLAMLNPYFTVFTTADCNTYTSVNCTQGAAGSASATVLVSASTTYLIAISDALGATGNFDLCITVNNDNSACNTNNALTVSATSMGSPLSGPYQPGEIVTFCYTITNWQQINCNYLQGIVPEFGDCWDPVSFNAQGRPVNIPTPLTTAGVIQPCGPGPPCAWNACAGTPSGTWSWFPAGAVTYNAIAGSLPAGSAMPAGWYFLSSYNPATGACTGDPTDPDNSYGDGNFPACGTNTLDWSVCFQLQALGAVACTNGTTDCSVTIRTYADGEIGVWNSVGCTADATGAASVASNICCTAAPTVTSPVVYCQNAPAAQLTATGSNLLWYTTATGGVGSATAPTPSTAVVGSTNYYVTSTSGGCESARTIITVTVNPNATITLTSAAATASQTVCANAAITNITYTVGGGGTGAGVTGLPAGVSGNFSGTTFTISGTPTATGTFNFTVTTTGTCTQATATGTIVVNPNATISLTSAAGTNSQTVCANTAITNITYSVGGGGTGAGVAGLPAGVTGSFAGGTFTISGTPTATGTFNYTVTTTGTCTQATATGTIIVNPNATITLTSAAGTNSQTLCANNAITNITYSVGGGGTGAGVIGLPAGVSGSFSGGTFTISGTPTATGTFNYTVTTTGTCIQATATGTIIVNPNATIALTSAAGTNAQTICLTSAITNITYSIGGGGTGGTVSGLPAGLNGSFAGGTFTISGTPTATGTFNYTVNTTGTCAQTSATGTITVNPNATITLTSAAATTNQTLCLTNAITNITYTVGGGATGAGVAGLPAGVTGTFSAGSFTISGTPTATGTFNYTVTTTGSCTQTTATGTIVVNPNATITLTSAGGTNAQSICLTSPITNITYAIGGGGTGGTVSGLPAGLTGSFAGGTFTISGTPTVTGTFNYTVNTTGTCTQTSATGTITINPNATITLTSAAATTNQTLCLTNAINNITYTIGGGGTGATVSGLPAGVSGSFSAGTFTISGTPTATGTFNYTVNTTGTCNQVSATGTIIVNPRPVITSVPFTNETTCGANDGTITINATGTGLTYSINNGVSFVASNTFTGLMAGTYNIVVSNSSGCTISGGVISISSAGAPAMPTAVATPNPLCAGTTLTLSVQTPVGGETYTWSGPGGYSATGTSVTRPLVTTAMSGVYTVTASVGACVSPGGTVTVTVNPNATIALSSAAGTNAQTICITAPITNIAYAIGGGGTGATVTGLPAGVTGSFSAGTFTISGTPTATGTFNYTVNTTGTCAQTSASGTITVNPDATITLTSAAATTTQSLCVNTAITNITYTIAGGGTGGTVTGLPAGVSGSFAGGTFTISGTPTATGTFNYTVNTTGTCVQASATGSITVNPNATITLTSAAATTAQTLCVNTALTNITYVIAGGGTGATVAGLPAGVTGNFSGGTFTISGTPTATGTFNYTVNTTGTCVQASATGSITVNPDATITLTSAAATTAQSLCVNTAITNITYTIAGGGTGGTVTGLPAGVSGSFAGGTFTISGTPTATGTFNYTVNTSGTCVQASATGSITVNPNATITLTSAAATTAQTLCVNTALTNITYVIAGGGTGATVAGLPAGVTGNFSGGTFTISGTPTATGTFNYTVNTTGTCVQASATGSITVNPDATITLTSAAATTTQSLCVNTAITDITYTIAGGGTGATVTGLPAGVTGTFAGGTFTISGTPTATGTFNYTVNTSGTCVQASATGSITVNPDATITLTSAAATTNQILCINVAITDINYTVAGGGTGATVAGLPAGVSGTFSGGTFTISGTPTAPGTFNYTVTTTGTCLQVIATGTIIVNPLPSFTISSTDPTTCTGTDGTITLAGLSVSASYNVTYNNGATVVGPVAMTSDASGNIIITGLSAGTYSNFIVEAAGCSTTDAGTYTLTDPSAPVFTVASTNPTTCGGNDGTITIAGLTANTSYSVSYTSGASVVGPTSLTSDATGNIIITGLSQGSYTNIVVSISGCNTTDAGPYNLTDPGAASFAVSTTDPSTCGGTDGEIILTGLTANTAYNIAYLNGATAVGPVSLTTDASGNVVITGLGQGSYSNMTVELAGCSTTNAGPFILSDPAAPVFTVASANPTACGGTDGSITISGLTANTSYNVTYTNGATVVGPAAMTTDASGNIVITGLTQGSYSNIIVSLAGCNTTDAGPYTLSDPGAPVYTVSSVNPSVCGGTDGSITLSGLTANTAYDVTYSNGATVVGPVSMTSNASGSIVIGSLSQGSYSNITVTLAGCSTVDAGPYALVDPSSPVFVVSSTNPTTCGGADGALTISGLIASTSYNVTYSNGATVVGPSAMTSDASGNIVINGLSQGSYNTIIVGLSGCNTTDAGPYTLTDPSAPVFTVTPANPTTCGGTDGSITLSGLTANTSYNVTYSNGATVVGPTAMTSDASGNIIVTGLTQGSYSNIIANLTGCSTTDAGPYVLTSPTAPAAPTATGAAYCQGDAINAITATGTGGTFSWYDDAALTVLLSTGANYTPSTAVTHTYYVTETVGGCQGPATPVTITINSLPVADAGASQAIGCGISSVNLDGSASASGAGIVYNWTTVTGNILSGANTTVPTVNTAGMYIITVTNSTTSCTSVDSVLVTGAPSPIASFSSDQSEGYSPLLVDFTNSSQNANTYIWSFGDGSSLVSTTDASNIYITPGTYTVMMVASNNFQCPDTATATIVVFDDFSFVIPNVFTPNGDNNNDMFKITSTGVASLEGSIFDRWGLKIYDWNQISEGWDGRTQSGVEVSDGTYYYIIKAKGQDGKEHEFTGFVQLIR